LERYPGKHLFIDDGFIESMTGLRRVLNEPAKRTVEAPLAFAFDRPWEQGDVSLGHVAYDGESRRFRMYYTVTRADEGLICCLESRDGEHWERPELDLVAVDGARRNNVTRGLQGGGLAPFWDPHATDAAFQWKRIDNHPSGTDAAGNRRWQASHSADGYDWSAYPEGPYSAQTSLFNFGARPGDFGGVINPDAPYVYYHQRGSGRATRILGRRDSADALNWSGLRTVIDVDLDDPPGTEFYSAGCDIANRTFGGLHLIVVNVFATDIAEPYVTTQLDEDVGTAAETRATPIRTDGFVDTQLAASRDTVSWRRYRQPFLRRGEPGAWDSGMVYGEEPIEHDGKVWFFYSGYSTTHLGRDARGAHYPSRPLAPAKGVATLRADGYVSLEAEAFAPGVLTTHRFRQAEGGSVFVNVDASVGELRYELLRDTGEPVPGCTAADCVPIRTDERHAALRWGNQPGWPAPRPEEHARYPALKAGGFYAKLRFYVSPGAKLYSLTLDPPEVAMWRAALPRKDR